jgi:hypothetical protein
MLQLQVVLLLLYTFLIIGILVFPFSVLLLSFSFCSYSEPVKFNSCKKHLSMELKCLFQYIVNQLKKGLGTELVVLEVC